MDWTEKSGDPKYPVPFICGWEETYYLPKAVAQDLVATGLARWEPNHLISYGRTLWATRAFHVACDAVYAASGKAALTPVIETARQHAEGRRERRREWENDRKARREHGESHRCPCCE